MYPYSYEMLMVPASKVFVPPIVVIRTRSNAPPRAGETPEDADTVGVLTEFVKTPLEVHVLLPSKVSTTAPLKTKDASALPANAKPVVELALRDPLVEYVYPAADVYPVVLTLPLPI